MKINDIVNEINMDHRTGKDFNSYDLDEFIGRTEHVGDIKGREIHLFDEDGPEEFIYLIGDKNNEAFDGYMLIVQDRDGYYRTNVFFDESIQGKGMAVPLYAFAIKHSGKTVVSDKTQTKGSKLLWQKLAKTPGINVYAWNPNTDEYSHYDPDVETDEEIWADHDTLSNQHAELVSKMRQLDYDHASGEIPDDEWQEERDRLYQQAQDLHKQGAAQNDIRLVATKE